MQNQEINQIIARAACRKAAKVMLAEGLSVMQPPSNARL